MNFLGEFTVGDSVFYAGSFHNDQGTIENPTSPEAQLRTPAGVWSDITAPAIQNAKTGHYGGTIDTTGFAVGQYSIRMAGTVATAKVTACEFTFKVKAAANDLSAQQVRDAMKLAPTAGAPASGSVDDHLDDVQTKTDQLTFTAPNIVDASASLSAGQIASIATAVAPKIWSDLDSPTRTLTQSAAQVAAILAGAEIVALRGDKWVISLTGVGALTGRTKLWFSAKRSKDDSDAQSIIQIEETDGLLYLNGEEAEESDQGVIDVTVESTGSLTITVLGLATARLAEETLFYDIQILDAESNPITRASGTLQIVADVTRNAGEDPEAIP